MEPIAVQFDATSVIAVLETVLPQFEEEERRALQALEEIRTKKEAALNALSVLRTLPAAGLVHPAAVAAQALPAQAQPTQDTTEQQPTAPAQAPTARKAARKPAAKKAAPAGEKAGSAKASARKATKGVRVPAPRKPAAGQQQPAAAKRGRLSAEGVLAALGEFTEPVPAKDVTAKLGLDGTAANVNNVRALLGQLAKTSRATNPKRGMYAALDS
ncbi:hypothetical protein [Kitasatospora sp. NPDC058190]|uniref:hypothetical protein n=1 Tax=Kitasatospora sp. NPDC058190 TaxID=3346371 RepID=UPI0036DE6FF4